MSRHHEPSAVRFGLFEFDLERGELRKEGRLVRLQPQPARALSFLVAHAGELVSRADLQKELWGDSHVQSDAGLNFCIRQVRDALDDRSAHPTYIQTLRGQGYRFVAPVSSPSLPAADPSPRRPLGGKARWLVAAAVLIVAGWALWPALTAMGPVPVPAPAPASQAPPPKPLVLAVLPFETLGGAADLDYLAYGLTDELITHLSLASEHLAVTARSSTERYRNATVPVERIARELEADLVLVGTVRADSQRIRVTTQLIRADDRVHMWTESFDTGHDRLLDTQRQIARRIVAALPPTWQGTKRESPTDSYALLPAAHAARLQGRYHLQQQTGAGLAKAVQHFETVIALEPGFASGYVDLAEAVSSCPFGSFGDAERTRTLLGKALALDPQLAAAHYQLGLLQFFTDWDWPAAKASFEQALMLNRNLAMAYKGLAFYHSSHGEHGAAIRRVEQALALDPVSVNLRADLGWFYYRARRYQDARRQCLATLELEPDDRGARSCLLATAIAMGDADEAWLQVRQLLLLAEASPQTIAELDEIAASDRRAAIDHYRRQRLSRLEARAAEDGPIFASSLAIAHAELRQTEQAIHWLQQSYQSRSSFMPFLAIDPQLDTLRDDARFEALLDKLDLPASTVVEASVAAFS